jgi:hypothetical protein
MGYSVHGWVERHDFSGEWSGVLGLDSFLDRGDLALSILFGGSGWDEVTSPLGPVRGFPHDLSPEAAQQIARIQAAGDMGWPQSWVTWDEVRSLDWDQPVAGTWFTVHRYDRSVDPPRFVEEVDHGRLPELVGHTWEDLTNDRYLEEILAWQWEVGDQLIRMEWCTLRDAFAYGDWPTVLAVISSLQQWTDPAQIRIVHWCQP